jgi:hypothetical protein
MPAASKQQQKLMGIVRALQKGDMKPSQASGKAKEMAKSMKKGDVKDFASTKHKGLPKKVKKEDYDPTKMYVVLKPMDNLDAAGLIKELNPLEGLQPLNIMQDDVHSVVTDESEAQRIAAEVYGAYVKKVQALEEKKGKVGDKLKKTIDQLEKKRKQHVDMAKEDPKNASQHKEHIAKIASQIDDLMSKMEKIEKSKKNVEKVEDEKSDKKKDKLKEEFNPSDKVTLDVPLFIRLLEYAREDAKTDMDLHNVAEKAIELSQSGMTLSMKDYESLVGGQEQIAETENIVDSIPEIQRYLKDLVIKIPTIKGIDTNEVKGIVELINSILAKLGKGSVGPAINATNKVFNQRTQGLK